MRRAKRHNEEAPSLLENCITIKELSEVAAKTQPSCNTDWFKLLKDSTDDSARRTSNTSTD